MRASPRTVPALIAALPAATNGRIYIVIGNGTWGSDPDPSVAWGKARSQSPSSVRDVLVYTAAEGTYLDGMGMNLCHDTAAVCSEKVLMLRSGKEVRS